jgi:DNA-binding transcriptional LysR family regulator
MININHLRTFITVVESGGVPAAAKKISLTQQGVLFHIQKLEDDLGIGLFERRGRTLELTGEGKKILSLARELVLLHSNMENKLLNQIDNLKRDIIIAAGPVTSDYILPYFISAFKKEHPEVNIRIDPSETFSIIKGVLDHTYDIGFIGAPVKNSRLEIEEWIKEEILFIVPPHHPFAKRDSIKARELMGQKFVFRKHFTGLQLFLENRFKEIGLKGVLKPSLEVPTTTSILTSVQADLGVSFLSKWVAKHAIELGEVVAVPIEEISLVRFLYIISKRNKRKIPAVKHLLDNLLLNKNEEKPSFSHVQPS